MEAFRESMTIHAAAYVLNHFNSYEVRAIIEQLRQGIDVGAPGSRRGKNRTRNREYDPLCTVGSKQELVYTFVLKHPGLDAIKVEEGLRQNCRQALGVLVRKGLIRHTGKTKNGVKGFLYFANPTAPGATNKKCAPALVLIVKKKKKS